MPPAKSIAANDVEVNGEIVQIMMMFKCFDPFWGGEN